MSPKALLVVHGIGEQVQGETTEKLVRGLAAAYGDRLRVRRDEGGHAVAADVSDVSVRFYEVYWADLLSREANRGALTWSTMPTLVWHPMLCRHAGLLPRTEYPLALVAGWLAVLLPASLLGYPLSQGAHVLAEPFELDRMKRLEDETRRLGFWARGRALADGAAHGVTIVEEAIDGTVADVPNYMSSIARGEGVGLEVLGRFHRAMRAAREDGCAEVHVLAHSLGTVVAYHALTGLAQPEGEPPHAPRRLYTIGSPLEKIRFFWPWTVRGVAPSVHPDFRWTNFYHRLDAVSGRLKRFQAWARHEDVRLKGGGGILRSHVVYERSPQFIGTLTEELFGARAVPHLTTAEKLKDRVLTAGENLAGPLAILASLAVGLALLLVVLLSGPFVMALPLRLLGADQWADRLGDSLSGVVLVMMLFLLVRELRRCYGNARDEVARAARRAGPGERPARGMGGAGTATKDA